MVQMECMPFNMLFRDTHHLKLLIRISNLNHLLAKVISKNLVGFLFSFEDKMQQNKTGKKHQ
jgi:hypothetical protein